MNVHNSFICKVQNWRQANPSTGEWTNILGLIHRKNYYSIIKRNELLRHARCGLVWIMLSERSQAKRIPMVWLDLYRIRELVNSYKVIGRRSMVSQGWGWRIRQIKRGNEETTIRGDKNVCYLGFKWAYISYNQPNCTF